MAVPRPRNVNEANRILEAAQKAYVRARKEKAGREASKQAEIIKAMHDWLAENG
ncbi:hypothetical protein SEA_YABOI_34 [Streptomyces phage Yaboi]|jgi:hypothetical protein|uniref:Uncharacterized protein n=3 Tax=Streptomyces virus Yaboi TaxID=2846408 RepID=A0A385UIZ0_9CAUD|nr:hypothetical protein HWB86_gp034 [Streptomyces phage Yaboi]QAY08695.1 hypothetical protein SEA_GENIE2_33 [Streptomyces phage Genie2]QAY12685.1 hypothetical protein SEA_BOOMERJR_33 [Streptomyces phage BoomerJR]UVD39881.1 hypothetical protein SEA_STANIMAL_33 [Streptomyces phage Stanimal]WNM73622.1 hypothetical protein SEA_SOLLERTIA_33 [Streptomyces phage Sollertia]AYB70873.1 hypothetical protein SEA_YABOI_34 [Streptomyces phage Yaboi]